VHAESGTGLEVSQASKPAARGEAPPKDKPKPQGKQAWKPAILGAGFVSDDTEVVPPDEESGTGLEVSQASKPAARGEAPPKDMPKPQGKQAWKPAILGAGFVSDDIFSDDTEAQGADDTEVVPPDVISGLTLDGWRAKWPA